MDNVFERLAEITKPFIKYRLISQFALYYHGESIIFNIGDKFTLFGDNLSNGIDSPFFYNDEIIRLPNSIIEPVGEQISNEYQGLYNLMSREYGLYLTEKAMDRIIEKATETNRQLNKATKRKYEVEL